MIECSKHYLVFFGVFEISITPFAVKKKHEQYLARIDVWTEPGFKIGIFKKRVLF